VHGIMYGAPRPVTHPGQPHPDQVSENPDKPEKPQRYTNPEYNPLQ
jgi:hypothetical protein